jgi:hypothetical protein
MIAALRRGLRLFEDRAAQKSEGKPACAYGGFGSRVPNDVPTFCSRASYDDSFTRCVMPATLAVFAANSLSVVNSGPEFTGKRASVPASARTNVIGSFQ